MLKNFKRIEDDFEKIEKKYELIIEKINYQIEKIIDSSTDFVLNNGVGRQMKNLAQVMSGFNETLDNTEKNLKLIKKN